MSSHNNKKKFDFPLQALKEALKTLEAFKTLERGDKKVEKAQEDVSKNLVSVNKKNKNIYKLVNNDVGGEQKVSIFIWNAISDFNSENS